MTPEEPKWHRASAPVRFAHDEDELVLPDDEPGPWHPFSSEAEARRAEAGTDPQADDLDRSADLPLFPPGFGRRRPTPPRFP